MPTDRDPDYDADLALVRAYVADPKTGLSIAEIEVSVDDIEAVRRACENAEWTGYSVRSHPNVECALVTCVFDPTACEIEDVADALRHITNESTTVADEREAPVPPEYVHRSYSVAHDSMTRRLRAVCSCGWRSGWQSNGGLVGAAWDTHRDAEISK